MTSFNGKKILLAVTGSIAAYKAAFLTRLLVKAGAEVRVLMTEAATAFISPLTLSTLSGNKVFTKIIAADSWNSHVELGLWADAMVIAPATANTLSKMVTGHADNMVVAVYLSARCPVFFAPAMDFDMWRHPSTLHNVKKLKSFGNIEIPVGHGELASGLVGDGRMAEPEVIMSYLQKHFEYQQDFKGKKALITAGPTYEAIDPVRFIGNRSSGKMGIALADNLAKRGAEVTLVLGPSKLMPRQDSVKVVRVQSAQEMYEAAAAHFSKSDITIFAAAVADYRPAVVAGTKIKKKEDEMSVKLEKTIDIAATLGKKKKKGQITIGFALETDNELVNAGEKLKRKNFDFVVLNSLNDKGAGFNHDTNRITIIKKDNKIKKFELKSKSAVAKDIVDMILTLEEHK